jgi:hypothetical protein
MEYPDTPNPALAHTVNGLIKFCLQIKDALIACVEMVGWQVAKNISFISTQPAGRMVCFPSTYQLCK